MTPKEETLIQTADARVRIMVLPAGESVPWHFHSDVTDDIFCLEGQIEVELKEPAENNLLAPGQRTRVVPRRTHRVINRGTGTASYLLVQGGGRYDFLKIPD